MTPTQIRRAFAEGEALFELAESFGHERGRLRDAVRSRYARVVALAPLRLRVRAARAELLARARDVAPALSPADVDALIAAGQSFGAMHYYGSDG